MKKKSDAELLEAYQAHQDHDSLAVLFMRYAAQVLGICLRYLEHSADAEDAVMDIYTHIQKPLQKQISFTLKHGLCRSAGTTAYR